MELFYFPQLGVHKIILKSSPLRVRIQIIPRDKTLIQKTIMKLNSATLAICAGWKLKKNASHRLLWAHQEEMEPLNLCHKQQHRARPRARVIGQR
jgi:hypothetical protein